MASTKKELTVEQIRKLLHEPKALPLGRQEFEEWSDNIIVASCLPEAVTDRSLKNALAGMIMHLPFTESHKPDAFFVQAIRKGAANQIAHAVMMEYKAEQDARKAAEAAEKEAVTAEAVEKEVATTP